MADADESTLIARCRGGDDEAFRELVERHKRMVYGLAVRLTSDVAAAEDLTQEVFLRVHQGLPYFRGEARVGTWIYRIVMNLCAQRRAAVRGRQVSLDERHEDGRPKIAPASVAEFQRRLEDRDLVRKALARLPPQYQVVIVAHYLEDVRYEELAAALEVPVGTVKTHLHRGRRLLREAVQALLSGEGHR